MARPFISLTSTGITPQGRKARLRSGPVADAVHKTMQGVLLDSAKVFVETLAMDVAVETGESFGSLVPLARFVGASLTLPSIIQRKRPQLDAATGLPQAGTRRSFASGVRRGAGSFEFVFTRNRLTFKFIIPIFQFALHDSGRATHPNLRAKGATDRAVAAQTQFIRSRLRSRVGSVINNWIATGTVKVIERG